MTVSEVTYQSEDYYLVENVTGTGGGEGTPTTTNQLQCFFIQNTSCPSGSARLIGIENDTHNGYINAHAQNNTNHTYNYSICCNTTNISVAISGDCPGNTTVIRLSNSTTNAHVAIGNYTSYNVTACLGSSWKRVYCYYSTAVCSIGYECVMGLAGSEGTNTSNAHVADCSSYTQNVCCALVNNVPNKPILNYPVNNNGSVFERRPNFNWSNASDPDGGYATHYTLNISCGGGGCSCYQPNIDNINTTNYTITTALCVDTTYNWSVTACDAYDECNTSDIFNFSIKSEIGLVLIINTTDFGTMTVGQNLNTTDESPSPLVVRNTGNVLLNVTINATNLFTSISTNTQYYQFKADFNETNSYETSCSQHLAFANMINITKQTIFCNFSYEDASDEGEVELNITAPSGETAGAKNSSIEIGYEQVI
jgi:hypothetical protein